MSTLAYADCDAALAILEATPPVVAATPAVGQIIVKAAATMVADADTTFKPQKKARTDRSKKVPSAPEKVEKVEKMMPQGYTDATSSKNINMVQALKGAWGVPKTPDTLAVWDSVFPADKLFLTDNFILSIRQHPVLCASVIGLVDLNVKLKEKLADSSDRVALLIEAADLATKKMELCAHPAVKQLTLANLKIAELLQQISVLEKTAPAVVYEELSSIAKNDAEVVDKPDSSLEDVSRGGAEEHHNTIGPDDYNAEEASSVGSSPINGTFVQGAGKGPMKHPRSSN
jgi:hypothetical protein